ncbi:MULTISPECIES: DUF1810 domain-containing protein [Arthrobacter]|uniref:DUF1810 domain-containing protein n=1 Tax=Arthrobacter oryzae TaxID=409290 RepID=A0A3N0BL99_9MICC|nr:MULTISPECIES: DUF1810 domain-containing protein [Arthrobacter]QYF91534.1 DUF1810 domain-containing protein [Arthrobacter sp. PAMC25284]RNL48775.1 DUF1810 domain-containing protein [Arthrobacter oryzae]
MNGTGYGLDRFETAQDSGGTYLRAIEELRAGSKRGHWMWFIFPQVAGLGHSATSRRFAIASLAEARAYLRHPVLGPRLVECAGIVAGHTGYAPEQIFGGIDALKLHSSMTLFHRADPDEPAFSDVLAGFFDGRPDSATVRLLDG